MLSVPFRYQQFSVNDTYQAMAEVLASYVDLRDTEVSKIDSTFYWKRREV